MLGSFEVMHHLKVFSSPTGAILVLVLLSFSTFGLVSAATGPGRAVVGAATPQSVGVNIGSAPSSLTIAASVGLFNNSQRDLLNQELQAIYTPGSYLYHSYLSPEDYTSLFAPSPTAYSAAVSYFNSFGITTFTDKSRLFINLDGTVAQLQQAFGTSIGMFAGKYFNFYANTAPLTLPTTISPYVTSVVGLENYTFFIPTLAATKLDSPALFSPPYQPSQLQGAYNESGLLAAGTTGTGQTIVLIDAGYGDKFIQADISQFSLTYSLPVPVVGIQTVNSSDTVADVQSDAVGGVVSNIPLTGALAGVPAGSGWDVETALDVEWSHAMAPGASLVNMLSFDPGPGLLEAIAAAIADHSGTIISQSFGGYDGSADGGANSSGSAGVGMDSFVQYTHPFYAEAAAEGITVLASSGDWGNTCPGASLYDVGTCYPSSDPFVTSVGGTSLIITQDSWTSESAWTCDPGCGGGGFSSVFARPSWQTGPGVPVMATGRGMPDVAADADPNTGVVIVDAGVNLGAAGLGIGGTSLASPLWAGMIAVLDQAQGQQAGLYSENSAYPLLNSPDYTALFHDITSGNNCYQGNPCYNTTVGWDAVTGVGSPNVGCIVSGCVPAALVPGVTITSPTPGQTLQSTTLSVQGTHSLQPGNFQTGTPNSAVDHLGNSVPSLDILQAWFSDYRTLATGQAAFNVNLRIQDLTNIMTPTTGALGEHWEIKWSYGGASNYAEMLLWYTSAVTAAPDGTGVAGLFFYAGTTTTGTTGTTVTQDAVNGTYTAAAPGVITLTVPTSDVTNPTKGSILTSASGDTQEFIGSPVSWLQFTVSQVLSPSSFSYKVGSPLSPNGYVQVALNPSFVGGTNATLVGYPASSQWTASLDLTGLPSGQYTVYARQVAGGNPQIPTSVPFNLVSPSAAKATLTVQTNNQGYLAGKPVQISGSLKTPKGQPIAGRQIGVEVDGPSGSPLFIDQVATTSTGLYRTSFDLPPNAPSGTYALTVGIWGLTASTTFSVGSSISGTRSGSASGTIYSLPSTVSITGLQIHNSNGQSQSTFTNGQTVVADVTISNSGSTSQTVYVPVEFLNQHGQPLFIGGVTLTVGAGQSASATVTATIGTTFAYSHGKYITLGFAWNGLLSKEGKAWNAYAPRSSTTFSVS
jgi:Pro-kumamolisin, activation domain